MVFTKRSVYKIGYALIYIWFPDILIFGMKLLYVADSSDPTETVGINHGSYIEHASEHSGPKIYPK